jgi:ADP-heptose:LPS heptosyltransferase
MFFFLPLRVLIQISRLRRRYLEVRRGTRGVIRTLLLCELTRMGDVLTILPMFKLFRDSFPSCTIHVIADERYITTLRAFDRSIVVHGIPDSLTAAGTIRARKVARTIPADLACSMSPSRRNAWVALSSRAPAVVGYIGTDSSLTPFLSSYTVEGFGITVESGHSFGNEPVQLRIVKIAHSLGIRSDVSGGQVKLNEEIIQPIESELRARGNIPDRPYVVIQPFAGWEYRAWPLERFGWLAGEIVTHHDRDVVFLHTQVEEAQIASLKREYGDRDRIRFVLSKDVLQSAVLIKRAELFVGNDSGPLHLAGAVGTPHVGLFGPAGPDLTSPAHPLGHYLFRRLECSPCRQERCIRPYDPCMHHIDKREVFASVSSILMTDHSTNPASYG